VPARIQNGVFSQCAINTDVTSETYEDMAAVKCKGKEDHTPTERWWGAHLPFYGSRKTANSSISTTPLKFEDVPARNAFAYLQIIYIARN